MGIGKMSKGVVADGIGKFAKNRFGIGKMEYMNEDRKANIKASEDMDKMMKSKK
jgi:hypothetical protein